MKNKTIGCFIVTFFIISFSVVTINAQGLKLYLDGPSSEGKLISSVPDGGIRQRTVTNGTFTITYGNYFLTDDISGTDYTLHLLCASTSTRDFTTIIKIGNQEVVNTTFSVSGAQYTFYNIPVVGVAPNISDSAEVELIVTVNGTGPGVTSGIKWDDRTYSYIIIPSQVTQISEGRDQSLPNEFCLSQNYPNPFNPATTIQYNIPVAALSAVSEGMPLAEVQHVTLTVYDVLGREVATLVNEQQRPGYYEVEFDATNISSGVYYYQLRAGNLIANKKMALLK